MIQEFPFNHFLKLDDDQSSQKDTLKSPKKDDSKLSKKHQSNKISQNKNESPLNLNSYHQFFPNSDEISSKFKDSQADYKPRSYDRKKEEFGSIDEHPSSPSRPTHQTLSAATIPVISENSFQTFTSDELKSLNKALLESIKKKISPSQYQTYFSNSLTISEIDGENIDVVVATDFIKSIITKYHIESLNMAIMEILGKSYQVRLSVINKPSDIKQVSLFPQKVQDKSDPSHSSKAKKKNNSFFIDEIEPNNQDLMKVIDSKVIKHQNAQSPIVVDIEKTFDNFIVGPSNNIAHALAYSVAKDPGQTYPALYIYGNSGLGKTHLIHAIANYIQLQTPNLRVCVTSTNHFGNQMIESIKNKKTHEFKKYYTENIDILIVDDIHELKNRTTTQDMFFQIFNELVSKNKQLVFTSDKTPKEIDGIEDRIRTRLASALPVEIQQPDLETRIAILKKKAVEKDIYLSDDVVNLIAKCIKSNIRELEGCLIKLGAITSILKVDIDLEVAKEHLNLSEELEKQKNLTIESISKIVAQFFEIPIGDIKGKSRSKEVVLARQITMYLISKMIRPTLKDIGIYFSGRDHSTVLHSIKSMTDRVKSDHSLGQQVRDIEKIILS